MNIANLSALQPLKGVSYSPAPSDDTPRPPLKYFDTDFANSTFPLIWTPGQGGRGDVKNLADIGVNFLHLYDWSVPPAPGSAPGAYQRNHLPFLEYCGRCKVKVMVPISNYFMEQIHQGKGSTVKSQIQAMVAEVYNGGKTPLPGAGMWGIANEYDLAGGFNVKDVVQAMAYLLDAEQALGIAAGSTLPVTSPVSFGTGGLPDAPAIAAIQKLKKAVESYPALGSKFWTGRFVASANTFNDGAFLARYIQKVFPGYFPDLPFFFAEMGIDINGQGRDENAQAKYVATQLANTPPEGNFLGRCVFQFLNQSALKTGTEATFGMTKYSQSGQYRTGSIPAGYDPGGGQSYRVDELTEKPLYKAVQSAYSG